MLAGKSPEAAAAFPDFIAQPEQALFWSTVAGCMSGDQDRLRLHGQERLLRQAAYKGREVAILSLTASDPTAISRGIRLGSFLQIRRRCRRSSPTRSRCRRAGRGAAAI